MASQAEHWAEAVKSHSNAVRFRIALEARGNATKFEVIDRESCELEPGHRRSIRYLVYHFADASKLVLVEQFTVTYVRSARLQNRRLHTLWVQGVVVPVRAKQSCISQQATPVSPNHHPG